MVMQWVIKMQRRTQGSASGNSSVPSQLTTPGVQRRARPSVMSRGVDHPRRGAAQKGRRSGHFPPRPRRTSMGSATIDAYKPMANGYRGRAHRLTALPRRQDRGGCDTSRIPSPQKRSCWLLADSSSKGSIGEPIKSSRGRVGLPQAIGG